MTYEESGREWGDGLEKHLCGESSFPGPEPEQSLQVLGLSLWAPGERLLRESVSVSPVHFWRILGAELAGRPRAEIPGLPESVIWY